MTTSLPTPNHAGFRVRSEQLADAETRIEQLSPQEIDALVRELQGRQVQLESQNQELRQAQLELQQARDRYGELYDFAPVGYLTLDKNGVIRGTNFTAATLLKVERAGLLGRKLAQFIDVAYQDAFHLLCQRVRREEGKQNCELRIVNGEQIAWISLDVIKSQLDADIWLATLCDVGPRMEAEASLRELEAKLSHVARLNTMGEMVAVIAHEVNQPLFVISNLAGACEVKLSQLGIAEDDELRVMNRQIAQAALLGGGIIKRLRAFVEKSEPVRCEVDLNEVVRETVQLLAPLARWHRAFVRLELESHQRVLADRVQIQQVLVNLVRNSFEAMASTRADERIVTIRTSGKERSVEVVVEDHGKGLSTTPTDTMFDAFVTTKAGGMGMGLAISRTIVESHSGRIWCTPSSPSGLKVHFSLPARRKSAV